MSVIDTIRAFEKDIDVADNELRRATKSLQEVETRITLGKKRISEVKSKADGPYMFPSSTAVDIFLTFASCTDRSSSGEGDQGGIGPSTFEKDARSNDPGCRSGGSVRF